MEEYSPMLRAALFQQGLDDRNAEYERAQEIAGYSLALKPATKKPKNVRKVSKQPKNVQKVSKKQKTAQGPRINTDIPLRVEEQAKPSRIILKHSQKDINMDPPLEVNEQPKQPRIILKLSPIDEMILSIMKVRKIDERSARREANLIAVARERYMRSEVYDEEAPAEVEDDAT